MDHLEDCAPWRKRDTPCTTQWCPHESDYQNRASSDQVGVDGARAPHCTHQIGRIALVGLGLCVVRTRGFHVPPLVHAAPSTGRAIPWLRSRLVSRVS
ncbi:conserved hypothetical protein [Xanthomonas citri pv. citri]|nr:conserved hypothetical protein [Xanthomonas citri pv. citri]